MSIEAKYVTVEEIVIDRVSFIEMHTTILGDQCLVLFSGEQSIRLMLSRPSPDAREILDGFEKVVSRVNNPETV